MNKILQQTGRLKNYTIPNGILTVAKSNGAGFCSSTFINCICLQLRYLRIQTSSSIDLGSGGHSERCRRSLTLCSEQKQLELNWNSLFRGAVWSAFFSWLFLTWTDRVCINMHKWYAQGATSQFKMNPGQKSQVEVGNWTTKLWMMWRVVSRCPTSWEPFIWSQCSSWK